MEGWCELWPITRTRNTRLEEGEGENKKFSLSRDNAIKRQASSFMPQFTRGWRGLEASYTRHSLGRWGRIRGEKKMPKSKNGGKFDYVFQDDGDQILQPPKRPFSRKFLPSTSLHFFLPSPFPSSSFLFRFFSSILFRVLLRLRFQSALSIEIKYAAK